LKIEEWEVRSTERERQRERDMHTHTGSLNNVRVSKKATATQHMGKCAIQIHLLEDKEKSLL
jgi:hypothetical protein